MMAALSSVSMYVTCEVRVIHRVTVQIAKFWGVMKGSLVETSEGPAAYIFTTIKKREKSGKIIKERGKKLGRPLRRPR
jgi:hypothetical protein